MRSIPFTLVAAAVAFGLSASGVSAKEGGWISVTREGQPITTGSGNIVRQSRPVQAFTQVELLGASVLFVTLGKPLSLAIQADDNLIENITAKVEGGTLTIGTRGSFRTRTSPRVYLTAPRLESLKTLGSGNVLLEGVNNNDLELVAMGSGDLMPKGRTKTLSVKVNGSGRALLGQILAQHTDVQVNGSGKAWIRTNGTVRARANGSGNIYLAGKPKSVDSRASGGGKIIRISSR